MGNPLSFNWSMHITDIDGDLFTWTIQCSNGQTQAQSSATNGTKILTLTTLTDATTYIIWVNATDSAGSGIYTRKWYSFITREINLPPEPPSPSNTAPIADASAGEPYHGLVNETILFNGSKSYDPDGFLTAWSWAFGDHTNGTGITAQHAYSTPGIYIITLTVKDNQGVTHTDTTRCLISTVDNTPPTQPTISGTTNGKKNTSYLYTILSTDADNDTIYYTVDWGDPRYLPQSSTFLPNGSAYIINHSWTSAGRYVIIVIATDNQTESSSNITVYIDALQTGDIGYLLDNNSDGIYDTFYSDELQQLLPVQIKDNQYLLDSDGDGEIEYLYDTIEGLTVYQPSTKTPGFELIGIINAIMIFVLSWKRKNII